MAVVGGWGVAAGRETLGRLCAALSNTRPPSDVPHIGFLSMGISSGVGSAVNEMFRAVKQLGMENLAGQVYLLQDQIEQQLLPLLQSH